MLASLKTRLKDVAARTLWAYGPDELLHHLRAAGVSTGSTLVVHSSWLPYNGFRGKPADVVRVLKTAVGADGLLVMPSMPYHNMSSAEWLARGKPMNVRRSPSMMGMLSETFRRSEGVVRSQSVTHPLLAWGAGAEAFIAGHEATDRPFGEASPFGRMLERNALILGLDAPFSTFTFTHFVEDQLAASIPVPLYAPEPVRGVLVDASGQEHEQWVRVLSAQANRLRREHRLVDCLQRRACLHSAKVGHTALLWIRARDLLAGAQALVAEGSHFFDSPADHS